MAPPALWSGMFPPSERKPLMRSVRQAGFTGLAAIMLLSGVSLQSAAARILCHGEFQVTTYGLIPTHYCADEESARVAHQYGWHREAATVRTNPLSKVYICQTLGWDWRLQSPCGGYLPHGGGGH